MPDTQEQSLTPFPIHTHGACLGCGRRITWRDVSGRWPLCCPHCFTSDVRTAGSERTRIALAPLPLQEEPAHV